MLKVSLKKCPLRTCSKSPLKKSNIPTNWWESLSPLKKEQQHSGWYEVHFLGVPPHKLYTHSPGTACSVFVNPILTLQPPRYAKNWSWSNPINSRVPMKTIWCSKTSLYLNALTIKTNILFAFLNVFFTCMLAFSDVCPKISNILLNIKITQSLTI